MEKIKLSKEAPDNILKYKQECIEVIKKYENSIPKIGKTYIFLDNGDRSRKYKATVKQILKYKDAPDYLKQAYFDNLKECDWLYQKFTDYFIGAEIPEYDDNIIWFVRSKNGGWFSMDIQSDWQSGELLLN